MGEERKVYVFVANPEGKRPLEVPGVDARMESSTNLVEIGWGIWSGFSWLRIGACGGCCECGDEHSNSGATK
jgi:hypothetical protein